MYKAISYNPYDDNCQYVDVRSESEFQKGHIPGAINFPILSDEERHIVGHLYKNVSVDEARKVGLEAGSKKLLPLFNLVEHLQAEMPQHKIVFYCSRGGYRSTSVALLLRGIGLPVHWVSGGYKAYRQVVLNHLSAPDFYPKVIVLHGLSGTGKTHVLKTLQAKGLPVLDLESIANHKGSHLGHIGIEAIQTQQGFENQIFHELLRLNHKYCFAESESKRIGDVFMPQMLYDAIQTGEHIILEAQLSFRVQLLVSDYTHCENFDTQLKDAITKLSPYTSNVFLKELTELIDVQNYALIAQRLLLEYYDPLYQKSIIKHEYSETIQVSDINSASSQIASWFIAKHPDATL